MSFEKTELPITFNEVSDLTERTYQPGHSFAPDWIITGRGDVIQKTNYELVFAPLTHDHSTIHTTNVYINTHPAYIWAKHTSGYFLGEMSGHWLFKGTTFAVGNSGNPMNCYASSFIEYSSRSIKTNISDISSGEDEIKKLRPRKYEVNTKDTFGFIVDESPLEHVFSETLVGEGDPEILEGIRYTGIVPINVKAIQELFARIEALEVRVMTLEKQIEGVKL